MSSRRWPQLVLLVAANWAVNYAAATLGPLQEALRAALSLSDSQIAWLQGPALAVPLALICIPFGFLAGRYSRARLFACFSALALIGTVASAFAPDLGQLLAARCLVGVSTVITVGAYAFAADLYPPEQRGRATMVVSMGESFGQPAAFMLGGALLAASLSMPEAHHEHWRWALLWTSAPLLPIAAAMLMMRDPPCAKAAIDDLRSRDVWPMLWRDRTLILTLLSGRMMTWIAVGAVAVWAAPAFSRNFSWPPDRVGAVVGGALLLGALLGPLLGGPLADWCQRTGGPRRTIIALSVLAISSALPALFGLAQDATSAAVSLVMFLTLGSTIGVAASTLGVVVVPAELRSVFIAITITAGALVYMGVAPLAVSALSTLLGGPAAVGKALALVCAGTSLFGASVFIYGARHFPRTTPALE